MPAKSPARRPGQAVGGELAAAGADRPSLAEGWSGMAKAASVPAVELPDHPQPLQRALELVGRQHDAGRAFNRWRSFLILSPGRAAARMANSCSGR
jgi:hypothetical protein